MLIVMQSHATEDQISAVCKRIESLGLKAHPIPGSLRTAIGITGNKGSVDLGVLESMPGVIECIPVSKPYKLVSRDAKEEDTVLRISTPAGDVFVGGKHIALVAGPCAVETEEQCMAVGERLKATGVRLFRGGAYKPRTSPYEFQGLGVEALRLLRAVREELGMPVVTEVMSTEDVDLICEHADMLQVGARNMQNFALLRRLATANKPILLKRGPSASVKEWLLAAEYLLAGGNPNVVLCERGIKTFETETRNTLDLASLALARELSHLPVVADPSHGTGRRSLIAPMSRAAAALGADGLIVEVHPCPERALSDGAQSLDFEGFRLVMDGLNAPLRPTAVLPASASARPVLPA